MRYFILVIGWWLVCTGPLYAQASPILTSQEDAKNLSVQFMSKIHEGNIRDAFASIKPFMTIPDKEYQKIEAKTSEELEFIKPQFGKSLGVELIDEKHLKDFMVRYIFLQKYEKHVLRWVFIFYRPGEHWILNVFYMDSKAQDLF